MNPWELACCIRFQVFPFIEDHLKRRPVRTLLEIDTRHPKFMELIQPTLQFNQFTRFCKIINTVRHKKFIPAHIPYIQLSNLDEIEALFWEEENADLARRILQTLLQFPAEFYPHVWISGLNLLQRAISVADKECALTMLEAFHFLDHTADGLK